MLFVFFLIFVFLISHRPVRANQSECSSEEQKPVEIKENLYWVGAFDPELRIFDIIMETKFGTSYNSYLVVGKGKSALIETVKEKFQEEMYQRVKTCLEEQNIPTLDYIIHNHAEPDHSGSSYFMLKKFPNATVIASQNCLDYLNEIWNHDEEKEGFKIKTKIACEEIKSLDLGGITLSFHFAPFLHWPDTMFTYINELDTLLTCDFLGTHFCFEDIFDDKIGEEQKANYYDSVKYYYDCIFSPFKKYVLKGLQVVEDIKKVGDIDTICTSHGPVLRNKENIERVIQEYRKWSIEDDKQEKKITIVYVSAYGYTKKIAEAIKEGITSQNVQVKVFDPLYANEAEIVRELGSSHGILFGSPTILSDALPNIWKFINKMNPIIHLGKYAGCFGSYGWSGEATENMDRRLQDLKFKLPLDPLKVRFNPKDSEVGHAKLFGEKFARAVNGEKVEERSVKRKKKTTIGVVYPTDGKLRKWKCIVCGEVVVAVTPPSQCPACAQEGDIWVSLGVVEEDGGIKSDYEGIIAIVGGGTAGVTACKTIRDNNEKATVLLFSEEGLPYFRPSVTKLDFRFMLEENWYDDNNVEIIEEEVTEIEGKFLSVESGNMYPFDKLILSTGSKANNFFESGKNVFTVFTPSDVNAITSYEALSKGKKADIVVIGCGLLGIEISELILQKRKENVGSITVLEMENRILPKQLDVTAAGILKDGLEANGLNVMLNVKIDHLNVVEEVAKEVVLSNGKVIKGDMVIVTIGSKTDLILAKQLDLQMGNRFIKVNEKMETNLPDVFAAGNIAEFGGFVIPNYANAVEKGEIAGFNVIGIEKKFQRKFSPYSISSFGIEASSSGRMSDNFISKKVKDSYVRFSFDKNNKLQGVIAIGKSIPHLVYQNALANKISMQESLEFLE